MSDQKEKVRNVYNDRNKNKQLYASACAEYLHHCDYKEFFVSGIYNVLAARGADLRGFATDLHLPFGTPAEHRKEYIRLNGLIK